MSPDLPNSSDLRILVADDHEIVLRGTLEFLRLHYPEATIVMAKTVAGVLEQVATLNPQLIVLDLSLPQTGGEIARTDHGVQLLKTLMQTYPDLNFTIQSTHIQALVRIKPAIDSYRGGFTVVDKRLSSQEMLMRVEWALKGVTYTRDIRQPRVGCEMKPEWLQVLWLAFHEGLQDRVIGDRMNLSERTVRHYWTKIYDALELYPDDLRQDGKSLRIQAERRAREEGLIDYD